MFCFPLVGSGTESNGCKSSLEEVSTVRNEGGLGIRTLKDVKYKNTIWFFWFLDVEEDVETEGCC